MLTLGFAGMDFGRSLHVYIALSNACRAGAEYGCHHPYSPRDVEGWETRIRQAVAEELSNTPGVDTSQLQTAIDVDVDLDGLYSVTVEVSLQTATFVTWPGLPHEVLQRQRATMRQQR
jgi:hypothetical protein